MNRTPSPLSGTSGKTKKRRWLKWPLLALIVFGIVAVLIPTLISSGPGTSWLLSMAGQKLDANVQMADLSLSWMGPSRVRDLQYTDRVSQNRVEVGRIEWAGGLWRAITASEKLGKLDVVEPKILFHLAKDEGPSKTTTKTPSVKEKPAGASLFQPTGQFTIHAGQVTLVQPDGRTFELEQIDGDFNLKSLNDIKGQITLRPKGQGQIQGHVQVSQLVKNNMIDIPSASLTVDIQTDEEIDLGILSAFLENTTKPMKITGKGWLKGKGQLNQGQVQADVSARVVGLQMTGADYPASQPIDVTAESRIRTEVDGKIISGQTDITSSAGTIQTSFTLPLLSEIPSLSQEQLLSAVLTGRDMEALPDIAIEAKGKINLPVAASAAPALLHMQPDIKVMAGTLEISEISLKGGPRPTCKADLKLENLAAVRQGRDISMKPIALGIQAALEPQVGLNVSRLECKSDFFNLSGQGTIADMNGQFSANLDLLQEQAGQFLDLNDFQTAGTVEGSFALARKEKQQLQIDFGMTGQNVLLRTGEQKIRAKDLDMKYKGHLDFSTPQEKKLITTTAQLNMDQKILSQASGVYEFANHGFEGQVQIQKMDLGYLVQQGMIAGPGLSGQLSWTGQINRSQKQILISGKGQGENIQFGPLENPVKEPSVQLSHQTQIEPEIKRITLKKTELSCQTLSTELTGTVNQYDSVCELDINGRYRGSWERLTALLHEFSPSTKETVQLTGAFDHTFKLTGPANSKEVNPAWQGVHGESGISWESAKVYGLSLGASQIKPVLTNGVLQIADTSIPVGSGKVNLNQIRVDMQSENAVLQVPGRVRLMENIQIDERLSQDMLSRINPIFLEMTDVTGLVSMRVENVSVPLDKKALFTGRGLGHLDFSRLQFRPRGFLAQLLSLANVSAERVQQVQLSGMDFSLRDNRFFYNNFSLLLQDQIGLTFSGSVGLDDTLDLMLTMPMTQPLLERFGVGRGQSEQYMRYLSGVSVPIPLGGTRKQPRLDLAKVNIQPLLRSATEGLLREQAGKALENIIRKPEKNAKPDGQPKPRSTEEQLLDIFLDTIQEPDRNSPRKRQ